MSPSSSFLTIDSSSAIAASKALMEVSGILLRVLRGSASCVPHFAIQLSLRERHPNPVPWRRLRRVSHDLGPIGVPADGISPAQDGQRAERAEAGPAHRP